MTSRTSYLREGTMDSQIHVANSPYVAGRADLETFRNTAVLNFARFFITLKVDNSDNRQFYISYFRYAETLFVESRLHYRLPGEGLTFVTSYLMEGPE